MEKLCKRCSQVKPASEFHVARKAFDGLYTYCKECARKKTRDGAMKPPKRTPPTGMKWCGRCKQDKLVSEFFSLKGTYDGLHGRCKTCNTKHHKEWFLKNREKSYANNKKDRTNFPERHRDYHIKKMYGLPKGTYDHMLESQGGRCAICKTDKPLGQGKRFFSVDHCHETNTIRGLLCNPCNMGIGQLGHKLENLQRAIEYLKNFPGVPVKDTPG